MMAGRLRHRITFERQAKQGGDFDNKPNPWKAIALGVPASVEPLRGREFTEAQQVQSQLTHKITTRWCEALGAVKTIDRIKMGDRVFNITAAINVDERNKWLEFMCVEAT